MMKAVICREFGPPETLSVGQFSTPVAGKGEVEVLVHAAGVSFADTLMIRDLHQNKHALPFVPGMEVAGTVSAVGEGVETMHPGDRVMALVYDGGYAERAVAKASDVFPLPQSIDFVTAAALSSVYLTSHIGLRWEARMEKGETLLVLGAAGGVGLAAVALGKAIGARVIAGASTAERLATAKRAGADDLINYSTENLKDRALELTSGNGVDVVFDPVAGNLYEAAFAALGWGGRYVIVGFAGRTIPQFPANRLLVKNRSALGLALMHYRRNRNARLHESAQQVFDWVGARTISAPIPLQYPLENAAAAMRGLLDRKIIGKAVLTGFAS